MEAFYIGEKFVPYKQPHTLLVCCEQISCHGYRVPT